MLEPLRGSDPLRCKKSAEKQKGDSGVTLTAGAHEGNRTPDPVIKSHMLYQLSYMSV